MIPVAAEIVKPENKPVLPKPDPIQTQDIYWKVLTDEDIIPPGESVIALSPRDYEILAQNMAEVMRWIKEASWRLDYYADDHK